MISVAISSLQVTILNGMGVSGRIVGKVSHLIYLLFGHVHCMHMYNYGLWC